MKREEQLPIDKGWAWVVVASASALFALQAGGFKCQGVLLVELTEKYEDIYPPATIIWVFTIKYMICGMIGPLVGFLVVKFTHRVVAVVGTLLIVLSYVGLGYSTNFVTMILLHSIPSGFGDGMIVLSALLVSGQYFKKKKALALGLIASGSGIGTVVLPYVYRAVFDNYNLSGACLLIGGFALQFLIPTCLFRPMSYYEKQLEKITDIEMEETAGLEGKKMHTDDSAEKCNDLRVRSASFNHQKVINKVAAPFHSSPRVDFQPTKKKSDNLHVSQLQMTSISDLSGSAAFLPHSEEEPTAEHESGRKDQFNWRVILMPKFAVIGVSICLYAFGGCFVYQALAAFGKETGISKQTMAVAIMLGGCLEIPCRIGNGMLADKKFISNTTQFALSMLIPGLFCLAAALISGLPGVALIIIAMSGVGTSVFSITPVVIHELVGPDYVTSGMSVQIFYQSLAFLSTSYIGGSIYSYSNSWRMVYFYVAAMMILASAIVCSYLFISWCRGNNSHDVKLSSDTTTLSDHDPNRSVRVAGSAHVIE